MNDEELWMWTVDPAQVLAYRNRGRNDFSRYTGAGRAVRQNMTEEHLNNPTGNFSPQAQTIKVGRENLERLMAIMDECKGSTVEITVEQDLPLFIELSEPGTNHRTEFILSPRIEKEEVQNQ